MATTVIARVVGAQLREPEGSAARYRALAASAGDFDTYEYWMWKAEQAEQAAVRPVLAEVA